MTWTKAIGYTFILAMFCIGLEILSFGSIYFLQYKYKSLIYDPDLIVDFDPSRSTNYSKALGWVTPIEERDQIGARLNNDFYTANCIDVFGDSWTFSAEVSKEFAWPNQLSKILGCKVNNFGVGGYGSDQATMRHELISAFSNVSILNHLSENITRNVNQFRSFLFPYTDSIIATKPRYVINSNDDLLLIKKPEIQQSDVANLKELKRKLEYEYFFPDGESGIRKEVEFPYFISAMDLLINHFHIKAKIKDQPRHIEFYDHAHPSNALALTFKIFDKFISNSKIRGQVPIITIIPTCGDLKYFNRHNKLPYQIMLDDLDRRDILYYDFSRDFIRENDFYKFFNYDLKSCTAHPNKDGYALMARGLANFLNKHKDVTKISF